jgi:hypothetical protein
MRALYLVSYLAVAEAMDKINDKYGEFVITPALMMGMDDTIIDRIALAASKSLRSSIRKSDFLSRNLLALPFSWGCSSRNKAYVSYLLLSLRHEEKGCSQVEELPLLIPPP